MTNSNIKIEKIKNKLKYISSKNTFYESMIKEWRYDDDILSYDYEHDNKNIYFNELNGIETGMMISDFNSYLPDDILCKVDRASMFSSLEVRSPFLNSELLDYTYQIPLKYKIRNSKTKFVLREILKKHLPEELYERPKQGFGIPISDWMRNDLKDWVNDMLSKDILNKHKLFNYNTILNIKNEHFAGIKNHQYKIWSLIQFNSWYEENY